MGPAGHDSCGGRRTGAAKMDLHRTTADRRLSHGTRRHASGSRCQPGLHHHDDALRLRDRGRVRQLGEPHAVRWSGRPRRRHVAEDRGRIGSDDAEPDHRESRR